MVENNEVVTLNASLDYGEFDGAGFEDTDASDYARCLVYVIQALSADAVEGRARPGDIKITGLDVFITGGTGLLFVPIHRVRQYVRWAPRDAGGGIVDIYTPDDPVVVSAIRANSGKNINLKVGADELVMTVLWGVIALPDGMDGPAIPVIIPLSKTKIKPFTAAMAKLRAQINPISGKQFPIFAHLMIMKAVQIKNKLGQPYFVPTFDFAPDGICGNKPGSPLLSAAVDCFKTFRSDGIKVDHTQMRGEDASSSIEQDDEVPF